MVNIINITNQDLMILGQKLEAYQKMEVNQDDIFLLHEMIASKKIQVENFEKKKKNEVKTELNKIYKDEYLEVLFSFYLNEELTTPQLDNLKDFYLNYTVASRVDVEIKDELKLAKDKEEFILILLNKVYPDYLNMIK